MAEMLDRVIEFASHRLGIPKGKITPYSKIENDFGMAGLDTISFYEAFFAEFGVTNPEEFPVNDYVTSENFSFSFKRPKSLTIGHLAKVAESKRWFEE